MPGPGVGALLPADELRNARTSATLREAQAKAICRECPVQPECLDYALGIREPHGIWGGLTEAERRLLIDA